VRIYEGRREASVAGRSHDNDNMADVVHPNSIHTTHIHTIYRTNFLAVTSQ